MFIFLMVVVSDSLKVSGVCSVCTVVLLVHCVLNDMLALCGPTWLGLIHVALC